MRNGRRENPCIQHRLVAVVWVAVQAEEDVYQSELNLTVRRAAPEPGANMRNGRRESPCIQHRMVAVERVLVGTLALWWLCQYY